MVKWTEPDGFRGVLRLVDDLLNGGPKFRIIIFMSLLHLNDN